MTKRPWQRRRTHKDHSDDWLMTYADIITLLLCFFVVFLLASYAARKIEDKDGTPKQDLPLIAEVPAVPRPDTVTPLPPQPDVIRGNLPFHDPAEDREEPRLSEETAKTGPLTSSEGFTENKGDRLTTFEIESAAFFESASSTLTQEGRRALNGLADKMRAPEFGDYQITVEGHTDDSPIKTAIFPSNWELSTARAASVVHFLVDLGFQAQRLRAVGYADSFPKLPNRDASGNPIPDNQSKNRRVVIKLEKVEKGR